MKKIIKRIVSCVLFVAILLGLLQVSSLVFQPKSNDKASGIHYPRANGIFSEPKDSIDTVFIGDSEVYHSFIPLISGGITELPRMMFLLRLKSLCIQWNF